MNIAIGKHWEDFVTDLVACGRYASSDEVIREGLRLMEEREARLASLRETIEASLARGGSCTDAEVGAAIELQLQERRQG
jgi:antitoxin ParD1/3/4